MSLRFRRYAGEDDYSALRRLIMRKFADPGRRFYPSLGDLDYIRALEEGETSFQEKLTICETENGEIVGAAWPGHFRIVYCVSDSRHAYLENEMFEWIERHYCGPSLQDRTGDETYVWGYEEDELRTNVLTARGYSKHTYARAGFREYGKMFVWCKGR